MLMIFRWISFYSSFVLIVCVSLALVGPIALAQTVVPKDNESADENPLRSADTSSPRDTFVSFNTNIQNAMLSWRAGEPKNSVIIPAKRALSTLDIGYYTDDRLQALQFDLALMLKEVINRVSWPPLSEIPGDDELADRKDPLTVWKIPQTNIEIGRVQDGPRKGEYLFTRSTLERIKEDFDLARDLPYRSATLAGIYDEFTSSPGLIVPRSWASWLPEWSRTKIFEHTIWQWVLLVAVTVATFILVRWFIVIGKRWDARTKDLTPFAKLGTGAAICASIVVVRFVNDILIFGGRLYSGLGEVISILASCLVYLGIGWLIILFGDFLMLRLNSSEKIKKSGLDLQLLQAFIRLGIAGALVGLFLYASANFGVPLGPVLAGLGIGGAALALAVRPTLENVIAGLMLYIDKPVRIGDFCNFSDISGTVEDIGLQYTRIRKLDDSLVSLPNVILAKREVTNLGQIRRRLFETVVKLQVDTTAEQIKAITEAVTQRLRQNPLAGRDRIIVRLRKIGDYSLDVEIQTYVNKVDWLEFLAASEQINLEILSEVREAGAVLAEPRN